MGGNKNKNKFTHLLPPPSKPNKKQGSPQSGGTTLPSGELVELGNVAVRPDDKSVNTHLKKFGAYFILLYNVGNILIIFH
jgi:hypothetical protein